MRKFHLTFGGLLVVAFLLTGPYMDKYYNHMEGVPDGPRMLYRTRHIFILLSGLLNLGLAAYISDRPWPRPRALQLLGSGALFAAALLFIGGFFYEPRLSGLHTPLSHWGTYASVAGIVFHLLSSADAR